MRSFRHRVTRFFFGLIAILALLLILFYRGPGFGLLSLQSLIEGIGSSATAPASNEVPAETPQPIARATGADLREAGAEGEGGARLLRLELNPVDDAGRALTATVDGNPIRIAVNVANETGAALDATVALRVPLADGAKQVDCRVRAAAGETGGCELAIATDGWAWQDGVRIEERAIEATLIGRLGGQPAREQARAVVAVAPRPVILVHGFVSNAGTWSDWTGNSGFLAQAGLEGFAVGDGQFGIEPMDTGDTAAPRRGGNTIAQNADILARYVEAVRKERGAARIDLVAHSMGGLISRRYLVDGMPMIEGADGESRPVVAQLHLVGTPNGGSHCAVPLAAMGTLLPMSAEMTPGYVREVFNPVANTTRGVPLFVWAGDPVRDYAALVCTPLPTDAFVSVGSVADALPGTVRFALERIAYRHLAQTRSPDVFAGILPKLARGPSGFPIVMPDGRPDLGGVRLAAEEDLQVVLAAAPGDGGAVQLGIGPATRASFTIFGPGRPMGETAAAAEPLSAAPGLDGGALPAGAEADEGGDEGDGGDSGSPGDGAGSDGPESPPGIGVGREGGAASALAGRYEVGLPSGDAWGAAAFVESPLRLKVELPEARVAPGETLIVRAELSGEIEEGSSKVRLRLLAADGSVVNEWPLEAETGFATIFTSGAAFAGEGSAPAEAGVYALVVEVEGQTASSEPFSRVTARALIVE